MSVLVEALSLIIPRTVLDVSYPGGTDAFMRKMCEPDIPSLLVCADDELVSVSFPGAQAATAVSAQLLDLGIIAVDEDCFMEMAFVDQAVGPTMPCDWIEWRKDEAGYTCCWLAGTDPDPMHAPLNWTPGQSHHQGCQDHREEPGRCVKLADDDGTETWLDFKTGHVVSGLTPLPQPHASGDQAKGGDELAYAPDPFPNDDAEGGDEELSDIDEVLEEILHGSADDLMSIVRSMLDNNTYRYQQPSSETLTFTIRNEHATYNLFFAVQVTKSLVQLMSNYGSHAPAHRRVAVAEALSRINTALGLGNFELDFDDGDIRFRVACDVEDGLLSEKMASNMLSCTMYCMERFHGALMRVMFADVEPAAALVDLV
jgi:hypothetical protein